MSEANADDWELAKVPISFLSQQRHGCSYFERRVLGAVLKYRPNVEDRSQDDAAMWRAIQNLHIRWHNHASALHAAGLGRGGWSTWNTRANCRPVIVNVTPENLACGFVRLCPFCYARKCWREYSHLRSIMFVEGKPHCRRRVTASFRRAYMEFNTLAEVEAAIRRQVQGLRELQDNTPKARRLQELKGWFRSRKRWIKRLPNGGLRLVVETMLLGTSRGETGIPMSLFLSDKKDPPKRGATGLVFERSWYDKALTPDAFRKWMLRTMRYRAEWLTDDIGVSMAYNRPMLELKAQQFYGGGEFRWRDVSSTANTELEEGIEPDE